jgi:hypothetical protein
VCSIRNKTDDFIHHVTAANYDLCCISETWLRSDDPYDDAVIAQLKISGYDFKHSPRHQRNRGGGLAIFHKDEIKVCVLHEKNYTTFELVLWNVKCGDINTIIACVYRPPYSSKHRHSVPAFVNEFSECWSSILASYQASKLILLGDFNIHVDNPDNTDTIAFNEMLDSFDCNQIVHVPTHTSGHTLDLCIVPAVSDLNVSSPKAEYFISDHTFLAFHLNVSRPPSETFTISSRNTGKIDTEAFQKDLISTCDDLILKSGCDLAEDYDIQLRALLDSHAPMTVKSVKSRKRVAWFDKSAGEMKKQARKLERRWKKSGCSSDLVIYKDARILYRKYLKECKSSHFQAAITAAKGNTKKLYAVVRGLMGKQQSNPLPERSSDAALAQEFANYFTTKIEKIRNDLQHVPRYEPSGMCTTLMSDFIALSEDNVKKLVLNSKSSTSDNDPLPSALVKQHIDILCPVITKLVNESLIQGHFHDHWKTAIILPLLKKLDSQLSPSLYRPVSTLSFISKLTEKGCVKQLNDHLMNNDLHSYHQSAYKEYCSIETALCFFMDNLLWNMERGQVSVVVALDLSAAFDTIDHGVLDKVLMVNYGIRNSALEWFRSYLRDRQMFVKVDKSRSDKKTFNYSVPQGSCLGPFLFNLYASTITECVLPCQTIAGYADDHIIIDSFSTADPSQEQSCTIRLQNTLFKVKTWMESNALKMNTEKTEVVLFGSRVQLSKVQTTDINVAGDTVNTNDQLKYLGVWLDKNLSLTDHIQAKVKTAAGSIRSIMAIRDYIDMDTAKLLATSLVVRV